MSVTFSDLIGISVSEDSFLQIFQDVVTQQEEIFSEAHETILTACFRNPGLSPSLKGDIPQEVAFSRVRINQPIEKWYRVDAKTGSYQWSYFNKKYSTDRFSEENFVAFVREVLSNNPQALAIEHNNPWK